VLTEVRKLSSEDAAGGSVGFKPSRYIILAAALIVVVAAAVLLMRPGDSAKDFSLVDVDGAAFSLGDFRGRVVLIDFMATWCGPCRLAMPDLVELRGEFGEELVMLSIDVDSARETEDKLREWRDEWGAGWAHALDLEQPPVSRSFKVRAIPTIVIVDQEGKVAHTHLGPIGSGVLAAEISELLNR
jgi:thiol-disulfide isomerase/thioredoxin